MSREKVKNLISNLRACQNMKIIMTVKIGTGNKNSFILPVNRNDNYSNRMHKEENKNYNIQMSTLNISLNILSNPNTEMVLHKYACNASLNCLLCSFSLKVRDIFSYQ